MVCRRRDKRFMNQDADVIVGSVKHNRLVEKNLFLLGVIPFH